MHPTRWLCISTGANDEVTRKMHIWGVAGRFKNTIARVNISDTILMYARQELVAGEVIPSRITGIYEVISEIYEDKRPLFITPNFLGNESFPYRIKVKQIKAFKDPIPFKSLVPEMSFIKNKNKWMAYLRTAMREIPEDDYQRIVKEGK